MINLSKIMAMDVEKEEFHISTDGKTKHIYNFSQILDGKHFRDFPNHLAVCEDPHFAPKPVPDLGRGAQVFHKTEISSYIDMCDLNGWEQYLLPPSITKRALHEMGGLISEDSCIAWWRYCTTLPKAKDMLRKLQLRTEKDEKRNLKLNSSRLDASNRIDIIATLEYKRDIPDMQHADTILNNALSSGAISENVAEYFEIRISKSGKNKGQIKYKETWVMPLFVTCCDGNGNFRRDVRGQKIGIRTVLSRILQLHARKSGKGSNAAARAKMRYHRLRSEENAYRKAHDLPTKGVSFPLAISSVRKLHEEMNRALVRIFRDFEIPLA